MEAGRGPKRESVLVQRSCENEKDALKRKRQIEKKLFEFKGV